MAYPSFELTQNHAPLAGCPFTFTVTALSNARALVTFRENCAMIGMPTPNTWRSPWNRLTCTGLGGGAGFDDVFGAALLAVLAVLAPPDEPVAVGGVLVVFPAPAPPPPPPDEQALSVRAAPNATAASARKRY
jgi:hypothetical protein